MAGNLDKTEFTVLVIKKLEVFSIDIPDNNTAPNV